MLTIYAVLVAVTALGMTFLSINSRQNGPGMTGTALIAIFMFVYVLSMFALIIITYVYVSMHFYKTMYSAQGYLTHTLPVSPVTTFFAKLGTGLVWMLFSVLLLLVSILGIAGAASGPDFWNNLKNIDMDAVNAVLSYNTGLTLPGFIGIVCILMLVSCLNYVLLFYTSCSIGQLFGQYKLAASIIAGIVLYFAQQVVAMIILLVFLFCTADNVSAIGVFLSDSAATAQLNISIGIAIIPSLIFSIIYCIVNIIILRKHINLD